MSTTEQTKKQEAAFTVAHPPKAAAAAPAKMPASKANLLDARDAQKFLDDIDARNREILGDPGADPTTLATARAIVEHAHLRIARESVGFLVKALTPVG